MHLRTITPILAALLAVGQPASADRIVQLTPEEARQLGIAGRPVQAPLPLLVIPDAAASRLPPTRPSYPDINCYVASPSNPNDPLYPLQTHLTQHDVPGAWQVQPDANGVVVAVLDTGVAFEAWADPQGTYHQLSDFAGTAFLPGWDFVNEDAHPNDDHHHGSLMAAIVAETTDNAFGCAGLARGATILPVKVLGSRGIGTLSDVLEGIYFAASSGADVILLAFVFPPAVDPGPFLDQALAYARAQGALVVAAAGNDGAPVVSYPAASTSCIAVGAAKSQGAGLAARTRYSNFGTSLDLLAFGGDGADRDGNGYPDAPLAQTIHAGRPTSEAYYYLAGTSSAAASAAGTLALLLASGATPEAAEWHLLHGADDLEDRGFDPATGFGLMNPRRSLEAARQQPTPPEDLTVVSTATLESAGGRKIRIRVDLEVTDAAGNPARKVRAYVHFRGNFGAFSADDQTDARGRAHVFSPWVEWDLSNSPVLWGAKVDRTLPSGNRWDPDDVPPIDPAPGADLLIDHPIKDRIGALSK